MNCVQIPGPVALRIKIGPVQGFIRQARRTRDLWAGSFLLSWLAGKAMAAAQAAGGTITLPALKDDVMWTALTAGQGTQTKGGPSIATLPNQFTVAQSDNAEAIAKAATEAVRDAWKSLADAVWNAFLKNIPDGVDTRAIWNRQIDTFWRVTWSVGDDAAADGRGHWRFPCTYPPEEGGDHCSMMGDYQELSGYVRARDKAQAQDNFWNEVRSSICQQIYGDGTKGTLELGPSERLCAIALVKRLFPLLPLDVLQECIGWLPLQQGWDHEHTAARRLRKYPSTAFMAAIPWLLQTIEHQGPNGESGLTAARTFHQTVLSIVQRPGAADPDSDESTVDTDPRLTQAENETRLYPSWPGPLPQFFALDGTLFFEDGIARRQEELRRNRDGGATTSIRENESSPTRELQDALRHLQKATAPEGGRRQRKMLKASPHYALLRMDGDNIGKLLDAGMGEAVSQALATFIQTAQDILNEGFGLPLYLGGDDVLALLPLHTALPVAEKLRLAFLKAVDPLTADKQSPCPAPTLSGGLVFAHYTTPLGQVLDLSKELLDHDAKAINGRDSLAMAVLKSSGEAARWVTKWKRGNAKSSAVACLTTLVWDFAEDDERSSSFIHNLRERLADLFRDGSDSGLGPDDLMSLLLAERLRGRGRDAEKRDAAKKEMEQLASLCRDEERGFTLEPALIAKFLADNGGWYGASKAGQTS